MIRLFANMSCFLGSRAETINECIQKAKMVLTGSIEEVEYNAAIACSRATAAESVESCLKTMIPIFPGNWGRIKEELAAMSCRGSNQDAIETIKNCVIENLATDGFALNAVFLCRTNKKYNF